MASCKPDLWGPFHTGERVIMWVWVRFHCRLERGRIDFLSMGSRSLNIGLLRGGLLGPRCGRATGPGDFLLTGYSRDRGYTVGEDGGWGGFCWYRLGPRATSSRRGGPCICPRGRHVAQYRDSEVGTDRRCRRPTLHGCRRAVTG